MRNFYFSEKVRSEQQLYEDIIIESLKMYGQDLYYIPRDSAGEITEFRESLPSRYNSSHKLEMYIENTEGFDGEGDLFTRFGVEIRDEATFVVSRRRWIQSVQRQDNEVTAVRPLEGDLIYVPMTKSLFEITHVEHEQPFYQLSNLPVFKLRAHLFEYADEDLDTGIAEVDEIEYDSSYTVELNIAAANRGIVFEVGETIQQNTATGIVITGEISGWEFSTGKLSIVHISTVDGKYHEFAVGTGTYMKSNETFTISSINENIKQTASEQNELFDAGNLSFLDFSEDNPFGDPND